MRLSLPPAEIPSALRSLYDAVWDPRIDDEGRDEALLDAVYVTVLPDSGDELGGAEICLSDSLSLLVSDAMIDRVAELDMRLDTLSSEDRLRLLHMLRPPDDVSPIRASRLRSIRASRGR